MWPPPGLAAAVPGPRRCRPPGPGPGPGFPRSAVPSEFLVVLPEPLLPQGPSSCAVFHIVCGELQAHTQLSEPMTQVTESPLLAPGAEPEQQRAEPREPPWGRCRGCREQLSQAGKAAPWGGYGPKRQAAIITSVTSGGLAGGPIPMRPCEPCTGRPVCISAEDTGDVFQPWLGTDRRGLCLPHMLGSRSAQGLDMSTSH